MSTSVPLLDKDQIARLTARAREVVEYRKSGLSLNHIQGCPLDCAYCIRHTYGLWDQRKPHALMTDAEAVEQLASHRYFQPHITPIQILNRATDPFLPSVRPHTLTVLTELDGRGLRNHVLVITSLSYAVADVEGNGQQPPDLVELAILPITNGAIGEPVTWLVRPPRPIRRFATSIHGISAKDVASAPPFAEIEHEVRRALTGRPLIAHNAHVDVGVLQRELAGWDFPEVFDTLKLARALLPGRPSYSLGALVEALSLGDGMPPGLAPHRAAYDVLVTARLFARLATRHDGSPLSLRELRSHSGQQEPGLAERTAP